MANKVTIGERIIERLGGVSKSEYSQAMARADEAGGSGGGGGGGAGVRGGGGGRAGQRDDQEIRLQAHDHGGAEGFHQDGSWGDHRYGVVAGGGQPGGQSGAGA